MKKFLVAIMFGLMAIAAQAEATFEQIEGLIQQQNYSAAAQGLEVIIQNHPKSSKAFYAMAQAQAGLGNLEKARKALDIATGLNPTLDFAPPSAVASLRQAITPQTAKIEAVEESHFLRNTIMALVAAVAIGFLFMLYIRKKDEDEGSGYAGGSTPKTPAPDSPIKPAPTATTKVDRVNSVPLRSTTTTTPTPVATPAPAYSASTPAYSTPTATTTVVNNSSGSDMLTGVLIGNMMSNSHHHDAPREVVRERVIEREVPAKSSTWDDTPAPSRSSSWDDTPSKPSRSSSWDDDSSSKSSSSWSSSSSDSSSSWSSSSDSSSSSSSWD